jgi:hypothetical protein
MKIRMHRGGFEEAMATAAEIDASTSAVRSYLTAHHVPFGELLCAYYGFDSRNGWNTYIITIDGSPWAWCDAFFA